MNLIDGHVTKVISKVRKDNDSYATYFEVDVEYWDDGGHKNKTLYFQTEKAAQAVKPGYIFQH